MKLRKIITFSPAIYLLSIVFLGSCAAGKNAVKVWQSNTEPLKEMEKLRKQIKAPTFPDKEFVITNYGAIGDGKTMNTEAFKKAIGDCYNSGGGRVTVPPGIFLTGAIHLKSNVNLHLADSSTILFSTDPKNYLPLVFTR